MLKNVIAYLEQAAVNYPEKIGFYDELENCTFSGMVRKAKKIGTQIIQQLQGKRNKPIAVYMDKSVACLGVFFGIVYSGNFYVPIDVKSPVERVNKIFEALHPELIFTQGKYLELVGSSWGQYLAMVEHEDTMIEELQIQQSLERQLDVDPLYVLFTSGSTGVPKGVVVSHRSVIDYVEWLTDFFHFDEHIIFGNQAPFHFDNSVLDIYSTIRNGAALYIIPEKLFAFPARLLDYLGMHRINTIFWVPSALIGVANANVLKEGMDIALRKVLFCGEVMPNRQLNMWREALPDVMYANLYGPTEITDVCSCYVVDRKFEDNEPLPIGRACNNMEILLFNEQDELCKGQEIGEICVRGTGLAYGYYANDDSTKAVFIQNPLNPEWRDLVYRTGDLAYYNKYGELEYVGRKDYQIKHNGYRIELGEIEQAAYGIEGIGRACAIYGEQSKKIILFYTASGIGEKNVYAQLKNKLPPYMLPAKLVAMDCFALNANGKIDRKYLKKLIGET